MRAFTAICHSCQATSKSTERKFFRAAVCFGKNGISAVNSQAAVKLYAVTVPTVFPPVTKSRAYETSGFGKIPAWINCAAASPRRSRMARNAGFEYSAIAAASSGPTPTLGLTTTGSGAALSMREEGIRKRCIAPDSSGCSASAKHVAQPMMAEQTITNILVCLGHTFEATIRCNLQPGDISW